MSRHIERRIDVLEDELADAGTDEDRKAIRAEIRELQRELAEHDEWQREGDERGWR